MLALRTPIAGILIALSLLVSENVAMNAYRAAKQRHAAELHVQPTESVPWRPHGHAMVQFGYHRRCAD